MNALFVLSWLVAIAIATAQSILPAACDKSAPLKRPSGRETSTSAQPGKLSGPFNVPTQTTGLSNSALQPGRLTSQKPTGNQTAIRSTTIANFSTTRTTRNPTNNVSTTPRFPTTLSSNGTSIPPSKFKFFESDILGVDPAAILGPGSLVTNRWIGNELPYEISSLFSTAQRDLIKKAVEEINSQVAALRIVPRIFARNSKDYVSVEPGSLGTGCATFVGRIGGKQLMSLEVANDCFRNGIILHDFMHAMGFWHEQSRTDRDEYVDLNLSNVAEFDRIHFFQKYTDPATNDFGIGYDYNSLMHFGNTSFAVNDKIFTILPKPPNQNAPMGQRSFLSPLDIKKINKMYPPSTTG